MVCYGRNGVMNTIGEDVLKYQELDSLLVLKKAQEQHEVFNEVQTKEKEQLDLAYANFAQMTSKQMKAALQSLRDTPKLVLVQSNQSYFISKSYEILYSKEPWYIKPEENDHGLRLNFPDNTILTEFIQRQVDNNIPHIIVDVRTQKVMGYSRGEGILYHPDGTEFKKGDTLKTSELDLTAFKMPPNKALQEALLQPLLQNDGAKEDASQRLK